MRSRHALQVISYSTCKDDATLKFSSEQARQPTHPIPYEMLFTGTNTGYLSKGGRLCRRPPCRLTNETFGGDEWFPRSLINPNLACGMIEDILTTNNLTFIYRKYQ